MYLNTLVQKHTFAQVIEKMLSLYPDQSKNIEGYKNAFALLKKLEPVKSKPDIIINIEKIEDKEFGDYESVSGIKPFGDDLSYGLQYTDWQEWLAMPISNGTQANYSELEILAHCLYEMTWSGFSNEEVLQAATELFGKLEKYRDSRKQH